MIQREAGYKRGFKKEEKKKKHAVSILVSKSDKSVPCQSLPGFGG